MSEIRWIGPDDDLDELLTGKEAAEMLGVKPITIRLWVHRGHLRPVGVLTGPGGAHVYAAEDLIAVNAAMTLGRGERGLRHG